MHKNAEECKHNDKNELKGYGATITMKLHKQLDNWELAKRRLQNAILTEAPGIKRPQNYKKFQVWIEADLK